MKLKDLEMNCPRDRVYKDFRSLAINSTFKSFGSVAIAIQSFPYLIEIAKAAEPFLDIKNYPCNEDEPCRVCNLKQAFDNLEKQ